MEAVIPSGGALALVLARLVGLAATAPLLSDPALPLRARGAIVLAGAMLLAPLVPAAAPTPEALAFAVARELLFGALAGATASWALAAVENAGHFIAAALGLSFAAQYDAAAEPSSDPVVALAKTAAGAAFVAAGGLPAVATAAAHRVAPSAAPESLSGAASAALDTALTAWHAGLGLAGPVLLAAFTANLALAVAQRAVANLSVFSVGFSVVLALAGAAALGTADDFLADIAGLAQLASDALTEAR